MSSDLTLAMDEKFQAVCDALCIEALQEVAQWGLHALDTQCGMKMPARSELAHILIEITQRLRVKRQAAEGTSHTTQTDVRNALDVGTQCDVEENVAVEEEEEETPRYVRQQHSVHTRVVRGPSPMLGSESMPRHGLGESSIQRKPIHRRQSSTHAICRIPCPPPSVLGFNKK